MRMEVSARKKLDGFLLDVSFDIDDRIAAVIGPSGAGKTTLLNIIAGLIPADAGRVAIDGTVLFDKELGICLPPHRRRLGYIFQDARLLPHLTVRQNLLYGRWFGSCDRVEPELPSVVDLLDIGHLLDRRPSRLSGGEKQRVAIGRALLAGPRMLLMDEPLSSIDEARKAEILPYFERLRDETRIPILYVSHAIAEVERLATTLVALAQGRMQFVAPVGEALARLRSANGR